MCKPECVSYYVRLLQKVFHLVVFIENAQDDHLCTQEGSPCGSKKRLPVGAWEGNSEGDGCPYLEILLP